MHVIACGVPIMCCAALLVSSVRAVSGRQTVMKQDSINENLQVSRHLFLLCSCSIIPLFSFGFFVLVFNLFFLVLVSFRFLLFFFVLVLFIVNEVVICSLLALLFFVLVSGDDTAGRVSQKTEQLRDDVNKLLVLFY